MGCISSKQAVLAAASPALEHQNHHHNHRHNHQPARLHHHDHHHGPSIFRSLSKIPHSGVLEFREKEDDNEELVKNKNKKNNIINNKKKKTKIRVVGEEEEEERRREQTEEEEEDEGHGSYGRELRNSSRKGISNGRELGNVGGIPPRYVEAEHIAAGWPAWLSAAAGEAIHGWVPLRADAYEKLEKIGQGTYSSVFRAREVETGRMLALKKVHFDNFQRESVRFMAREIMILRKLDHPNIIKLEGLITSRLSCSIYLVFEYMEHDLAGLLSSPDVKFSEAQIKCYMKQLLAGVEHCHVRGIMHRDIKASNILVNNQGVLKLGDFGLANILNSRNRQSLTSRVVTLWYRPPELLMGSTDYGVSVDLWSVGCVFAELLIGRPVLKGRTEVEQLHKIFKLCGSPPDEYWKQCRLPLATMFKPQHTYESSLRERCKDFPLTAVNLIETLLSIEPYKRGTASSALISEYFMTKPFACDPSSLPKYPPNKEIDAKNREEARRKRAGRTRESAGTRKPRKVRKALQDPNGYTKSARKEEPHENPLLTRRLNGTNPRNPNGKRAGAACREEMDASQEESHFSGPAAITAPTSFAWAKRQDGDVASSVSYTMSSTGLISPTDMNTVPLSRSSLGIPDKENDDMVSSGPNTGFRGNTNEVTKHAMWKHENQNDMQDSFAAFEVYNSHKEDTTAPLGKNMSYMNHKDQRERVEFSGPLLSQSDIIDELLQRNERHIRRGARNSRHI